MGRRKGKGPAAAAAATGQEAEATDRTLASASHKVDGGVVEEEAEDVAQAELETIASRVHSRSAGLFYSGSEILLYDGDLIAFPDINCDPEVGYALAEVQGMVPDDDSRDFGSKGHAAQLCFCFNEEVSARGCIWMPQGLHRGSLYVHDKQTKWTHVKGSKLKGDRIRVSWAEHVRIQEELGVQGQVAIDEEPEEEEEEEDYADVEDQILPTVQEGASLAKPGKSKHSSTAQPDDDDSDGSFAEVEAPPTKKPRASRSQSSTSPGKAAAGGRKPRTPKPPKPIKYKKGFAAPRPDVELIERDPAFYGDSPVKGGSQLHSLDVIRAVLKDDMALLKVTFEDTENVSSIFSTRSPSIEDNSMLLALEKCRVDIAAELYKYRTTEAGSTSKKRVAAPPSSLRMVGSGSVGIATFGHHVGPVGAARGGRELQNALLWEPKHKYNLDGFLRRVWENFTDITAYERIVALLNLKSSAFAAVVSAARVGNRVLVEHVVKQMLADGGWNWNQLHLDVLNASGKALANFREVSVTKKGAQSNRSVTPVHFAAINPDPKYLKELLDVHSDTAVSDLDQWRIAHYAAACESDAPLRLLVERGADLMCVSKDKKSPILIAAGLGRLDNVKLLLADQQRVALMLKMKEKGGNSAMHLAALNGHVDVVEALIDAGAKETGCNNDHMLPMGAAAAHGHLDVIKKMKEKGFSLAKPDRRQRSPLILACRDGQEHVVRYLLHHGVDSNFPDSSGNSAAHYAAAFGWLHVLKVLVEEGGAEADAVASWKATPLSCAALKHQSECVDYLVGQKDVNLNVLDERGRTIVSNLCSHLSHPALRQLERLVDRGADVGIADAAGLTPLHYLCACTAAHPQESLGELIERFGDVLLAHGADAEKLSTDGKSPLSFALNFDRPNIYAVKYLASKGVSLLTVDDKGHNAMHCIANWLDNENQDAVASFLSSCLQQEHISSLINQYDSNGLTPLHVACQKLIMHVKPVWGRDMSKSLKIKEHVEALAMFPLTDVNLPVRKVQMLSEQGGTKSTQVTEDMDEDEEYDDADEDEDEEDMSDGDECGASLHHAKQGSGQGTVQFTLVDEDDAVMFCTDVPSSVGCTALHLLVRETCSDNTLSSVIDCLLEKEGTCVDARCVGGCTALHLALGKSNMPVVGKLLDAKASVNVQDIQGRTALHLMTPSLKNFTSYYTSILQATDLTLKDCRGQTCLHLAAKSGDLELCTQLLDAGCDLNAADRLGRIALHYAAAVSARQSDASSDLEAMLLKRGSSVNTVDVFGRTPVHYCFLPALFPEPPRDTPERRAKEVPLEEIIELVFKAEEHSRDKFDPIETVYCLFSLGKGILCDAVDKRGCSPLHYASRSSALTSALHLLTHGADINRRDGIKDDMPLRWALQFGNPEYSIMMLQKGAQTTAGVLKVGKDCADVEIVNSSVFYLAIQGGWLGVAYMIFGADFPLFDGLRDAMLTKKYTLTVTLMKKVEDAKLQAVDDDKRGLLHWLCMSASCAENVQTACNVVKVLVAAGCDVNATDKYGRTPLHYAAQAAVLPLAMCLVNDYSAKVDSLDMDNKPPLILAVEGTRTQAASLPSKTEKRLESSQKAVAKLLERDFLTENRQAPGWLAANPVAQFLISKRANCNVSYTDASYSDGATTLLCHIVRQGNATILEAIAGHRQQMKAACKALDGSGCSALMYAIQLNEEEFVKHLIPHSDLSFADSRGRTLAHYAVQPIKYGSYENVALLELLAKAGAPLSSKDQAGKTPMYYAKLQDSGRMAKALRRLGAEATMPGLSRERTVWQKIAENPNNVEEDSEAYIAEAATKEPAKALPDAFFEKAATSTVYENADGVLYDVLLNKVDISHGAFGYNNYYRMQVLHEKVQGAYYLWTHWGRWGDDQGMFQRTPFNTPAEACTEFSKIFRSKTGNDFLLASAGQFTPQPAKYSLMRVDRSHSVVTALLAPFDLDTAPASRLHETLQATLRYLTAVTSLRDRARVHGLSAEGVERVLMFGQASAEKLFQAKSVLKELFPVAQTFMQARFQPNGDVTELVRLNDRITKLSQMYYEIVPYAHVAFGGTGSSPMQVMSDENTVRKAMQRLEMLSDLSHTARLILAACYRRQTVNPLDYVMKALEASVVPLPPDHVERNVIEAYMITTAEDHLQTIELSALYKVERRGEPARLEKFRSSPNHRLLWHGSPQVNIMGILSQGLTLTRGNPASRMPLQTKDDEEKVIWNGLYFADMFAKSMGYVGNIGTSQRLARFSDGKEDGRCYMMLCEVALGEMQTYEPPKNCGMFGHTRMSQLDEGKDSLHCPGRRAPDWKNAIVLANGVEIPLGEVAHPGRSLAQKEKPPQPGFWGHNSHEYPMSEYIVQDEGRVRIRYILELKKRKQVD